MYLFQKQSAIKRSGFITLLPYLLFVSFLILANYGCSVSKHAGSHDASTQHKNNRKILLRDEGLSLLSYIDMTDPTGSWYETVPAGRDMQLVGDGRVLIGTGSGYEEREIFSGKRLFELTNFPGTIAARRLRNGHTLLTGLNWQGKKGIVLVEVISSGQIIRSINYPAYNYVRLVRETVDGTFLITSNNIVFEGNESGAVIWKAAISGVDNPHAWQALRLANGQTLVSTGYSKNLQVFSATGDLLDSISGPLSVNPHFYAGFQILPNGNYIVTNWQGHGPTFGGSGIQLLEYTPDGKLDWSWQQDSTKFSSLQSIIVLDDLDPKFLYIEDKNGKLSKVNN